MKAIVVTIKFSNLCYTANPVLRDHCPERPPVVKDQVFLAEGPTFQYTIKPAVKDHLH